MKAALCRYPIERIPSFDAWLAKLDRLTRDAANSGASLLVFPEYAAMELTSFQPDDLRADLHASIADLQQWRDPFLAAHSHLATALGITILAASFPWRQPDGSYTNRAWLCTPDGQSRFQDKIQMTRFEREQWLISGSRSLSVFDIPGARVGILICYDSEFPLLARQLTEAGVGVGAAGDEEDGGAGFG